MSDLWYPAIKLGLLFKKLQNFSNQIINRIALFQIKSLLFKSNRQNGQIPIVAGFAHRSFLVCRYIFRISLVKCVYYGHWVKSWTQEQLDSLRQQTIDQYASAGKAHYDLTVSMHVWLLEPGGDNASLQSYRSCTGFLLVRGQSSSSCAWFTSRWLDRHRRTQIPTLSSLPILAALSFDLHLRKYVLFHAHTTAAAIEVLPALGCGTPCHHICDGTWTTDISSMHWNYILCLDYS